jgi:hypothetical protein
METLHFFCLTPSCPNNTVDPNDQSWFSTHGYYSTQAFGSVRRYRCNHCGKTFSTQTFSLNYYLKKQTDFRMICKDFISQNSDLFTGRHNDLSSDSIRIRRDRIGRNALFFQHTMLKNNRINENVCADGFESFIRNKYYPTNLNILMGERSEFLYYFTHSVSRRKGRITQRQQKRLSYEYADKSFTGSTLREQFSDLIEEMNTMTDKKKILLQTDEHPTYQSVVDTWNKNRTSGRVEIDHRQTSSKQIRTVENPLFSVNYMDHLFRKDCPMFRRKTVCQGRNLQNMLLRVAHYMVSHNFFKPKRINSRRKQMKEKHHTSLNLDRRLLSELTNRFYTDRFFLSRVTLPKFFFQVWTKTVPNPLIARGDGNVPLFAFQ